MKQCSICKIIKDNNCFSKHPHTSDGLQSQCKPCRAKTRRLKDIGDRNKALTNENDLRNYYHKQYKNLVYLSKYRGVKVLLSESEFIEVRKQGCHYCGDADIGRPGGYNLDRIDSKKDYSVDNVVSCCWVCNTAKNDMTSDTFMAHIKKIYDFYIKKLT